MPHPRWSMIAALLLGLTGCPSDDDDSAGDDDDATGPGPLPVLAGDCGRYAFLEHGLTLDFDGTGFADDFDVSAFPDQGQRCERRQAGAQRRELCYQCDDDGVRLYREFRSDGADTEDCLSYSAPPLIWPAGADVGSTWTASYEGNWRDCTTGSLRSEVAFEDTVEIVDRGPVTVPAGTGDAVVLTIARSDGETSDEFVRWVGDGLGPIQEGEDPDLAYRWLAGVSGNRGGISSPRPGRR